MIQTTAEQRPTNWLAVGAASTAMLVVAVAIFFWIRSIGERMSGGAQAGRLPAVPSAAAAAVIAPIDTVSHVLVALAVIIIVAQVMRRVFEWLGQPAVVGEILGGIMLGPSVLGHAAPGAFASLLPPSVAPFLAVHAQIGIILYMFLVGLDLDLGELRQHGHATIAISHASIVAPFLLGSGLALVLYPILSPPDVPFTVFALFLAVSLSITAFPVLARILTDRNIHKTRMGALALTCAAINDVTAWCLLAFVVSVAHAAGAHGLTTSLLTLVFIAVMFAVVQPLVRWWVPSLDMAPRMSVAAVGAVFAAVLASATVTEYIGIHGIFGAFLFGATIPHDSRIVGDLRTRLDDVIAVLFLPAFFAYTGLRTEIGALSGPADWGICAAITIVACAGKFGGTAIAGRLAGFTWRDSAALGALMNTRGLVELIALNIGLDLGIITTRLFTMLVIMALATTFMATPAVQAIVRREPWTS